MFRSQKESIGLSCTSPSQQHLLAAVCRLPSHMGRLVVEMNERNCGGWEIGAEQEKDTCESDELKVLFAKRPPWSAQFEAGL
jgi:hypothetical protein